MLAKGGLSVCLPACLPACLFICASICPSLCPSFCPLAAWHSQPCVSTSTLERAFRAAICLQVMDNRHDEGKAASWFCMFELLDGHLHKVYIAAARNEDSLQNTCHAMLQDSKDMFGYQFMLTISYWAHWWHVNHDTVYPVPQGTGSDNYSGQKSTGRRVYTPIFEELQKGLEPQASHLALAFWHLQQPISCNFCIQSSTNIAVRLAPSKKFLFWHLQPPTSCQIFLSLSTNVYVELLFWHLQQSTSCKSCVGLSTIMPTQFWQLLNLFFPGKLPASIPAQSCLYIVTPFEYCRFA